MKAAKTALADLKRDSWSQEISGMLDEMSLNLLRGEFKKVMALAEKIMKE
jgi:hypothetical protein